MSNHPKTNRGAGANNVQEALNNGAGLSGGNGGQGTGGTCPADMAAFVGAGESLGDAGVTSGAANNTNHIDALIASRMAAQSAGPGKG